MMITHETIRLIVLIQKVSHQSSHRLGCAQMMVMLPGNNMIPEIAAGVADDFHNLLEIHLALVAHTLPPSAQENGHRELLGGLHQLPLWVIKHHLDLLPRIPRYAIFARVFVRRPNVPLQNVMCVFYINRVVSTLGVQILQLLQGVTGRLPRFPEQLVVVQEFIDGAAPRFRHPFIVQRLQEVETHHEIHAVREGRGEDEGAEAAHRVPQQRHFLPAEIHLYPPDYDRVVHRIVMEDAEGQPGGQPVSGEVDRHEAHGAREQGD